MPLPVLVVHPVVPGVVVVVEQDVGGPAQEQHFDYYNTLGVRPSRRSSSDYLWPEEGVSLGRTCLRESLQRRKMVLIPDLPASIISLPPCLGYHHHARLREWLSLERHLCLMLWASANPEKSTKSRRQKKKKRGSLVRLEEVGGGGPGGYGGRRVTCLFRQIRKIGKAFARSPFLSLFALRIPLNLNTN